MSNEPDVRNMTQAQFEDWKRARGYDAIPVENPAPVNRCGICGDAEPCGCIGVDHAHDEAGSFLTVAGLLVQLNEGGHNGTTIDIRELVSWLRTNRPDLLQ